METKLKHVDEDYVKKYFSGGSVFQAYKKYLLKCSAVALVLFGFFTAGALVGLIWSSYMMFSNLSNWGDTIGFAIGLVVFFLLVTAGCVWMLLTLSKGARKSVDHWVAAAAKNNGYTEGEVREFDRQAMESASLLVPTGAFMARTFKNGILTRDYIFFVDEQNSLNLLKCTDIVAVYLNTRSAPVMGSYKQITNVYLDIANQNGHFISVPMDEKMGNTLQQVLQERHSQIDTKDGKVLSEKEFGEWLDGFKKNRANK